MQFTRMGIVSVLVLTSPSALAQIEHTKPLIDTVAGGGVTVSILALVCAALFGLLWIQSKNHEKERDRLIAANNAERERHDKARDEAVNRFVDLVEKQVETTEKVLFAQERLRDAIGEIRAAQRGTGL